MQKKTGQQKQKCKNCEGKGTLKKRRKGRAVQEVRRDGDQAVRGTAWACQHGVCRHPDSVPLPHFIGRLH